MERDGDPYDYSPRSSTGQSDDSIICSSSEFQIVPSSIQNWSDLPPPELCELHGLRARIFELRLANERPQNQNEQLKSKLCGSAPAYGGARYGRTNI
jgi:hypothetical protein